MKIWRKQILRHSKLPARFTFSPHTYILYVFLVDFVIQRINTITLMNNDFMCTIGNSIDVSICWPPFRHNVDPGSIYFWIKGFSIAAARSGTSTRKHFPEPRSMPPNTEWPSLHCPLWYFGWKYLDSSISTVIGDPFASMPPIYSGLFSSRTANSSLKNYTNLRPCGLL